MLNLRRSFFILFGILLVGVLLHALTLPYSPVHWQDEVQIVECGRPFIQDTDWSAYWLSIPGTTGTPTGIWCVGSVIQAASCEVLGHIGSRVTSLAFLVLASMLAFFYFADKSKKNWVGIVCGLLLFAAPALSQSARGGRCESIAFAFLFAALMVVRLPMRMPKCSRNLCYALCGLFSALCLLTWPTAVFLVPIVLNEVITDIRENHISVKSSCVSLGAACITGAIVLTLIAIPFILHFDKAMEAMSYVVSGNAASRGFQLKALVSSLASCGGIYLLGLLGLILTARRNLLLLLVAIAFCFVCAFNTCYVFRFVYLLPYAVFGIYELLTLPCGKWLHRLVLLLVFASLLISIFWSVLLRNGTEFFAARFRDQSVIRSELAKLIPAGSKVYVEPYDLYFIGRDSGWKVFKTYANIPDEKNKCLENVDWYISNESAKADVDLIDFDFVSAIEAPATEQRNAIERFLRDHNRLSVPGPYSVYKRRAK